MMDHQSTENKRRSHHEGLTGEHPTGDAGQLVLVCLFLAVWIADTFFLQYTTFLNRLLPLAARITCGVVLLLAGGYLAKASYDIVFGGRSGHSGVIREGVFNVVRHPMYLSEIMFYLGLLAFSLSLAAAVVWAAAIGFLYRISRYEEKLLLDRFGEDYVRYMREVPMWIPRFGSK